MDADSIVAALEAAGLEIRRNNIGDRLMVASSFSKTDPVLQHGQNACYLMAHSENSWRLGHPLPGPSFHEMVGDVELLIDLIKEAYTIHNESGGPFALAWDRVRHAHGIPQGDVELEPALAP